MSEKTSRNHRKPERDPGVAGAARQRQCLMCGLRFASAWSGERICQTCKNRSAWRMGIQLPSHRGGVSRYRARAGMSG